MGSRGKINAISRNIKINLQKLVDIMWIWIANRFAKFHIKNLTEMKIFQKVLGGYFFLNTLYKEARR